MLKSRALLFEVFFFVVVVVNIVVGWESNDVLVMAITHEVIREGHKGTKE